MLGQITGVRVEAPPPDLIGRFLGAGRSDDLIAWLNREAGNGRPAPSLSPPICWRTAASGLSRSRSLLADAVFRLRASGTCARISRRVDRRLRHDHAPRPTGIPAGHPVFRRISLLPYLQQYANLHDPRCPAKSQVREHLRELIGEPALTPICTRARDLAVNRLLLHMTAGGVIDRLVLGQDDAGPVGLHVREVALLQTELASADLSNRVSIEPGADELGMALVAHAIARTASWTPRIGVRYSTPSGALYQDPIEYAPISAAIDALIGVCGGVRDDSQSEIAFYVRVPGTTPPQDDALMEEMKRDVDAGRSVAFADLSYLTSYRDQAAFAQRLLSSGLASRLDAYSSWNTNANTVGTALAEAIAAGAGRRLHTYDDLAHRTFTFVRFVDDYAYHDEVRPQLNATLAAQGITDHTLLASSAAAAIGQLDRALLWNDAVAILAQLDPGYHVAAISIGLPWDRTFETSINVGIAPNL